MKLQYGYKKINKRIMLLLLSLFLGTKIFFNRYLYYDLSYYYICLVLFIQVLLSLWNIAFPFLRKKEGTYRHIDDSTINIGT